MEAHLHAQEGRPLSLAVQIESCERISFHIIIQVLAAAAAEVPWENP